MSTWLKFDKPKMSESQPGQPLQTFFYTSECVTEGHPGIEIASITLSTWH